MTSQEPLPSTSTSVDASPVHPREFQTREQPAQQLVRDGIVYQSKFTRKTSLPISVQRSSTSALQSQFQDAESPSTLQSQRSTNAKKPSFPDVEMKRRLASSNDAAPFSHQRNLRQQRTSRVKEESPDLEILRSSPHSTRKRSAQESEPTVQQPCPSSTANQKLKRKRNNAHMGVHVHTRSTEERSARNPAHTFSSTLHAATVRLYSYYCSAALPCARKDWNSVAEH